MMVKAMEVGNSVIHFHTVISVARLSLSNF